MRLITRYWKFSFSEIKDLERQASAKSSGHQIHQDTKLGNTYAKASLNSVLLENR